MSNFYFRDLGVVERPSQALVLCEAGNYITELAPNEELHRAHFGEDGIGYFIEKTRYFAIDEQMRYSGDLQEWAMGEVFNLDGMHDEYHDWEQNPYEGALQTGDNSWRYAGRLEWARGMLQGDEPMSPELRADLVALVRRLENPRADYADL